MVGGAFSSSSSSSPSPCPAPANKTLFPSGAGMSASEFEVVSFKSAVAGIEAGVVWWRCLGLPHGVPLQRCSQDHVPGLHPWGRGRTSLKLSTCRHLLGGSLRAGLCDPVGEGRCAFAGGIAFAPHQWEVITIWSALAGLSAPQPSCHKRVFP